MKTSIATPTTLPTPAAAVCAAPATADAQPGTALPAPVEGTFFSRFDGAVQRYLLALPSPERGRPAGLVIYLHGYGSDRRQGMSPENFGGSFTRLRTELDRRAIAYATLDYRAPAGWMGPAAECDLTQLMDLLTAQLGCSRIWLMGGSMGGSSALGYAVLHPERLSGVVGLCASMDMADSWRRNHADEDKFSQELAESIRKSFGGTPEELPELYKSRSVLPNCKKLARMPVVLSYGDQDGKSTVMGNRELKQALDRLHIRVLRKEIPGGDHDSPVVQADWPEWLDFLGAGKGTDSAR